MTDNKITNLEQLQDFLFEIKEISSEIAVTYFKKSDIPVDEIVSLSEIKVTLDKSSEMISHIILPIVQNNQR